MKLFWKLLTVISKRPPNGAAAPPGGVDEISVNGTDFLLINGTDRLRI